MAGEVLRLADRLHRGRDRRGALGGQALPRAGLEELADPQAAGVAGGAGGRQHVVGADRLVAVGDGRLVAEEQRAVVAQALEVPVELVLRNVDLEVLVGGVVGQGDGLVVVGGDRDPAVLAPGLPGDVGGRPAVEQVVDLLGHGGGDALADGDHAGRGGRPVLGLAEQVGRDEPWVGRLVGDHQHLGRAGQQIDADAAEQLALGLGHVGVAGARRACRPVGCRR